MDRVYLVSALRCGIQQVLLIVEKFLALCALRCHSILLVFSTMCLLGGRIRSMGMIWLCLFQPQIHRVYNPWVWFDSFWHTVDDVTQHKKIAEWCSCSVGSSFISTWGIEIHQSERKDFCRNKLSNKMWRRISNGKPVFDVNKDVCVQKRVTTCSGNLFIKLTWWTGYENSFIKLN